MSRDIMQQKLASAAVRASQMACCHAEAIRIKRRAEQETDQLRGRAYALDEQLLALLHSLRLIEDRKAVAEIIATQLKEQRVDTGDMSRNLCDIMKDAGVVIYPPPWPHDRW
jgi:hypothetical protein